jgi:hypothetical protein
VCFYSWVYYSETKEDENKNMAYDELQVIYKDLKKDATRELEIKNSCVEGQI